MKPSLAIIGYGKMGKLIHKLAEEKGYIVKHIVDKHNYDKLEEIVKSDFDVYIDFSDREILANTVSVMNKHGKSGVIGTTGFEVEKIKNILKVNNNSGVIFSPNFSLGVNAISKILEYSSRIFNKFDGYDVGVFETHHRNKKDSPSGTAIRLANIILDNVDSKDTIIIDPINDAAIRENELHVVSQRIGAVIGEHSIVFDSEIDRIEISHKAKTREGFVSGALTAASWIFNKKGFFTMDDMMEDL